MTRQPIPLEMKAAEATPIATLAFSAAFPGIDTDVVILITPLF
jgi:hypothetical protein